MMYVGERKTSDSRTPASLDVLVWAGISNDGSTDHYDINKFPIGVLYMDKITYTTCDHIVLKDDNDILY